MFREKWENTETNKRYKTRIGAGLDGHRNYIETNKENGDHGINYIARYIPILTVLSIFGHSKKNIRKIQR